MAMMAEPPILLNGRFSNRKEKLQKDVDMVFKAMGINRDFLGNQAAILEFIRQSRSRLDETENKKKKPAQDCLPSIKLRIKVKSSEKVLDAVDRPENSQQGTDRNKRKASSYSGRLLEFKKVKMNPPSVAPARPPVVPPAMPAPMVPPEMPAELMNEITRLGGEDVGWVIKKSLMKTDVSRTHGRISIPENQVRSFEDSLTTEEMFKVKHATAIEVDVLVWVTGEDEPQRKMRTLKFGWWLMSTSGTYVLRTGWWQLVEDYHLQTGDEVQIWCFRRPKNGGDEKKLCFAIDVRRDRRNNGSS